MMVVLAIITPSKAKRPTASRYGDFVISKSREAKMRCSVVSQPPMKNTFPVSLRWPGSAPGDMNDGYQPSNSRPLPSF